MHQFHKDMNFNQIVSNDSFTDPEDFSDLADEMNYMSKDIASKDFDQLRQRPEAMTTNTPSPVKQSAIGDKFNPIQEISMDYTESPNTTPII